MNRMFGDMLEITPDLAGERYKLLAMTVVTPTLDSRDISSLFAMSAWCCGRSSACPREAAGNYAGLLYAKCVKQFPNSIAADANSRLCNPSSSLNSGAASAPKVSLQTGQQNAASCTAEHAHARPWQAAASYPDL
jgi:hypothetical protein